MKFNPDITEFGWLQLNTNQGKALKTLETLNGSPNLIVIVERWYEKFFSFSYFITRVSFLN
jgi:hypothetical protein